MFQKMRRFKQELTKNEIEQILEKNSSGVLAIIDKNGFPYSVPLSFYYSNEKIYFHSATTGHKIEAIQNCSKSTFCIIDKDEVQPEKYTTFYKSVIAFGNIEIVNDDDEIFFAINKIGEKYHPEHDNELQSSIEKSKSRFLILRFTIKHITGKQAMELVQKQ